MKFKFCILAISTMAMYGCTNEAYYSVTRDFRVSNIEENICIDNECSYTINGTVDVMKVQFKSGKEIADILEEGDVVDVKSKDRIITEIITY